MRNLEALRSRARLRAPETMSAILIRKYDGVSFAALSAREAGGSALRRLSLPVYLRR